MSLFRKPIKKIQRRVIECDEDEEETGVPEPPPPPIISKKKENKPAKNIPLLSFADEEEEEVEEFKVKKSSHSKKWSRRKEKGKDSAYDDFKLNTNSSVEEKQNIIIDTTEVQEKPRKKVSLEGLILSGREALSADGAGDISDGEEEREEEDEDEEDTGGFPRYRPESVRAALAAAVAPGHIPDAALIHAARKTRQKARELGGGDYIPIRNEENKSKPGSRLIRDDGSGDDDEDEGRLLVRGLELPSDKPKRNVEAHSDAEVDSEAEQWEEQQMQKAVSAITDIVGAENTQWAPPPPSLSDAPVHLRPLRPPPDSPAALLAALQERLGELRVSRQQGAERRAALQQALAGAKATRLAAERRRRPLDAAYRRAQAARGYLTDLLECLDEKMPELEALESRALALHRRRTTFLQDRRRADVCDQAADVLALAGRGGAARGAGVAERVEEEEKVRRTAEREGRRRARRLRRQKAAAAAAAAAAAEHRDGDSSDDELPPHEQQHYAAERAGIEAAKAALFADAAWAWRGVRGAASALGAWRRAAPALYGAAYVPRYLPRLLAPYVRHELILWNPLGDEDNEDYEKMAWYKCLMLYGVKKDKSSSDSEDSEMNGEDSEEDGLQDLTEDSVREDPDLMLVPTIVHRVIIPKLTELVECSWDPMCVRACVRLRRLLERLSLVPAPSSASLCPSPSPSPSAGNASRPSPSACLSPALAALAAAARARLQQALAADVFLPTLPPHVCEGAGAPFWRRSVGAGVRLLRGAGSLCAPPLLRADDLVLALIRTLCTAAGAAPPQLGASAAAALCSTLPRGEGASAVLRAAALQRLKALAELALASLHSDNPLHLKALEQARSVVAEARAAAHLLEGK